MTNYNPCGCTMGAPCSMVSQCTMDQVTEDMLADFSVEMQSMIERVTRYERALEEILEKAPANGEDVSYLIAKRALENK